LIDDLYLAGLDDEERGVGVASPVERLPGRVAFGFFEMMREGISP
jgi:hypothetical protein